MSNALSDPESRRALDAPQLERVVWILERAPNLLCCELYALRTGGWEMRVFEDGQLSFAHRWALEGSARFFAMSLKRERVRDGWSTLPLPPAGHLKTIPIINDNLAVLARSNCVYLSLFRSNLDDALHLLGSSTGYHVIDIDALPPTDAWRGFPSPTLLWRGAEIFGMPAPSPPFRAT